MSSAGTVSIPSQRAFPSHPCVDRYFPSASAEEARTRLMRVLDRADGPALVVGAPGMGKTMLLSVLAGSLADRMDVVSIASTQLCTRRALLQAILFGLGLPYREREEGELRLALVQRLREQPADRKGVALLIDEAQALPLRLLEELRVLTNTTSNGQPVLRLVLAGSAALEEQFASTELESFNQRLAARCYLSPLSYQETLQYVVAHVAAAGGDPEELFAKAAIDCVYNATDGVPRLINQLCDRALVMAVDRGAEAIDEPLVQQAWSDLHQLPAPWHTPDATMPEPETGVVEFGVLAGEDAGEFDPPVVNQETDGDWNADAALSVVAESATPPTPEMPEVVEPEAIEPAAIEPAADDPPAIESFASAPIEDEEPVGQIAADDDADAFAETGPTADSPIEPAAAETAAAEDEPVVEATPDAASLFGDGFDDEEVVVDRFAALELALTQPTSVATLDSAASYATIAATEPSASSDACCGNKACGCELAEVLPAADPNESGPACVLPMTTVTTEPAEAFADAGAAVDTSGVLGDILIVETEPDAPDTPAPEAERREYRQLFASLRREG